MMYHASQPPSSSASDDAISISETLLWDRKTHGGFPGKFRAGRFVLQITFFFLLLLTTIFCCCTEVKQLKSLVRNIIDPSRDLGHVDRALKASKTEVPAEAAPKGTGDTLQADQGKDEEGKDQGKVDETNQESQKDACQDCK